jgi:uncharacterized small protein (DUF1192 family)
LRQSAAEGQIDDNHRRATDKKGALMLEEPPPPRRQRGQALIETSREDLDLYSAEELTERIEQLQAEIERTRAQLVNKDAKRAAADAFFKR